LPCETVGTESRSADGRRPESRPSRSPHENATPSSFAGDRASADRADQRVPEPGISARRNFSAWLKAIVDGAPGLEAALAALWPRVPVQRCTVHKHRNLLAHAPKKLHDELGADYTDMIYAKTVKEVDARRKAFVRKWRLKCQAVVDSLDEAGPRLFTFLRYPPEQWKSIRTTNAIERLHEEFKRRIKTQCLLPCAETACMLFWALLASGQIALRRVNGWVTFHVPPAEQNLDLAA